MTKPQSEVSPSVSIFSEADFDRALAGLDLCLQDYNWTPGENYIIAPSLVAALRTKDITRQLAIELLRRLKDEKVFTFWSRTIPAGYTWEQGWPCLRLEPKTTHGDGSHRGFALRQHAGFRLLVATRRPGPRKGTQPGAAPRPRVARGSDRSSLEPDGARD